VSGTQGDSWPKWKTYTGATDVSLNHSRRLSLSYQRIPSWDTVTKFARPSKCQTFLCKNGIGDQLSINSTVFVITR